MEVKRLLDEYGGFAALALVVIGVVLVEIPGIEPAGASLMVISLIVLLAMLLWN